MGKLICFGNQNPVFTHPLRNSRWNKDDGKNAVQWRLVRSSRTGILDFADGAGDRLQRIIVVVHGQGQRGGKKQYRGEKYCIPVQAKVHLAEHSSTSVP